MDATIETSTAFTGKIREIKRMPGGYYRMFILPINTHKEKRNSLNGCALCIIAAMMITGCRRHAYTELYVDNMAGEIRALEDRIYEYDAAYQASESELEEQKLVNQALEEKLRKLKANGTVDLSPKRSSKDPPSILVEPESIQMAPKTGEQNAIPPVLEMQSNPTPEKAPSVMRIPAKPPALEEVMPAVPERINNIPSSGDTLPNPSGENLPNKDPRAQQKKLNRDVLGSQETLVEQVVIPDSLVRSAQQPKLLVTPPQPNTFSPGNSGNSNLNSAPSLLPKALQKTPPSDHSSIKKQQIKMPEGSKVQLASAEMALPNQSVKPGDIQDKKIIEIGFHPTLCRGHNFDQLPGDDGVYLVMTPLNASGQILNETATLTIVIEDESIQDNKGRIIAKQFKPSELRESLTPIGTSQGFHLSIPWEAIKPNSNQVVVYAKYDFEDGRSLVNHRVVHLRTSNRSSSVWTPRQ